MNLKRFINKNIVFIILLLGVLFTIAYFKTTDGFQACTVKYNGTVSLLRNKCVRYSNPMIVPSTNNFRCKDNEKYSFFIDKTDRRKCYSCYKAQYNPSYIDTKLLKCVSEV